MKAILELNQKNLPHILERVAGPKFDRNELVSGIVHFGVGGFHRAHQAFYLQRLLEISGDSSWGICGVGIRKSDAKIASVLNSQNALYSLITRHPNGMIETEIIGTITNFILGVEDPTSVIDILACPETKIVSLTITEGGYNFNPTSGAFDFDNMEIKHDLQYPQQPKTVYGFLAAALRARRDAGLPAFTIMSCDNIQHNGDVTRKMLLAFTDRQDSELAAWINRSVSFPNSMVDRITPVTSEADTSFLKENYGIVDQWPVTCEPFVQWVIEDKFSNGRPALEKVGVQFVDDVKPYEKMKLRLLNAGHSVLGILGAINGFQNINECMADSIFVSFMRSFMDLEVSPILDEVQGINLTSYKDSILERFANPNIMDNVSRICSESSAKLPKFLISTIHDNIQTGGSIKYATFVIAAWCYYSDKGVDKNRKPIDIIDTRSAELHEAARNSQFDNLAFIKQKSLFGDLSNNTRFIQEYSEALTKIYQQNEIAHLMATFL